jgi:arsenite/tail-anchored protein-transporting ATPase
MSFGFTGMGIILPFNADLDKTLDWKEMLMPKLVICSGKGGVGKTTVTAALASAQARSGKRIFVVSVDPAHSLGDSLCTYLGDGQIHPVPGFTTLYAQEPLIGVQTRNKSKEESNQDGSDDPASIQRLFGDVFLPVSEEMTIIQALINTWRNLRKEKLIVDEIYVDGSPSGHMLRALQFPFHMNEYLGRLVNLIDRFKRVLVFDAKKRAIIEHRTMMAESFKTFIRILSNPAIATTILVTIPETMAFAETERTFQALTNMGIHVTNLVINKIHGTESEQQTTCPFCKERIRNETMILQQIESRFGSRNLILTRVPLLANEIRGASALVEFSNLLFDQKREPRSDITMKASCF